MWAASPFLTTWGMILSVGHVNLAVNVVNYPKKNSTFCFCRWMKNIGVWELRGQTELEGGDAQLVSGGCNSLILPWHDTTSLPFLLSWIHLQHPPHRLLDRRRFQSVVESRDLGRILWQSIGHPRVVHRLACWIAVALLVSPSCLLHLRQRQHTTRVVWTSWAICRWHPVDVTNGSV